MPLRSRNAVSVHLRRETFFAICSYKDALRGFRAARKASLKASLGRVGLTSPSRNQPLSINQGRRPGLRFFYPATSSICGESFQTQASNSGASTITLARSSHAD